MRPYLAPRLETYIQPYFSAGDFSGVILVAQQDEVLFQKAYGQANITDGVPNEINTKLRIASLTKTFTAAAIVILLEKGKITLDMPLSDFLPDFPNGEKITIKHLLVHASGVGVLDFFELYREVIPTDELLDRLRKVQPLFEPGTNSSYSNEGYFLLSVIIDRITGVSYETFLQEQIFNPLGMKDTGNMPGNWTVDHHATGFVSGLTSPIPLPFDQAVLTGAGSLYSTAPDLLRWTNALRTNQLFHFDKLPYPVGWGKRNYSGHDLIEQSGLVEGFNAYLALYLQEEITVVFLSNIQSGLFNRMAKDMVAILFGGEVTRPPEVQAIALDVTEYSGKYTTPSIPVPLNLVAQDGVLSMHWGTYPFLRPLTPVAHDKFFLRAEYAQVTFERDETGKISSSTWTWDAGEPLVLTKTQ